MMRSVLQHLRGILYLSLACCATVQAQDVTVVEYYNQSIDTYFITGRANEQALLDGIRDFQRTGMTFHAQAASATGTGLTKICRFYISTTSPFTSTHFYGRQSIDCDALRQQNLAGFTWDDYDFATREPTSGACPPDTNTISRGFRASSVGKSANHRYTASTATYNNAVASGYAGEGAAFCASSATAASVRQPTASIRANVTTALRDNRVTLNWSSADAASCIASNAWGGVVAAQGNQSVVVATLGANVFELTCSGAGGVAKASATVSVSNDTSKQTTQPGAVPFRPSEFPLNYPAAFRAAPTAISVNDPYCSINADLIAIPSSYLGSLALPTPQGRLPNAWLRSIGLKDYFPFNPSSNNDCPAGTDYARAAYRATLDRAARLGVEVIWVYNYARWKDLLLPTWEIELSDLQIKDEEMTWLVTEAARRGMKVFLEWQLDPRDMKGNSISNSPTATQLATLLASYENVIAARAQAAQQQGIAGMNADWTAFWLANATENRAMFSAGMLSVLRKVRSVFSGKVAYGFQRIVDQAHTPYMDFMRVEIYPRVSEDVNQNLTVVTLKAAYLRDISAIPSANSLPTNVPVLWTPLIQSTRNFFRDGWMEDGFCVSGCPQYNVQTDYSVQAVGMEAMFQAITEQTIFLSAGFAYSSGYWLSDATLPSPPTAPRAAFPNVSQSIRNKPAEAVIQAWLRRN